ncbi:MAG TPA: DUF2156 domain-containing protein [Tepidiformaceae bacterium]
MQFGTFRWQQRRSEVPLSREGTALERYDLISRFAYNSLSFLTLYSGWEYFHTPVGEGFIAYERHNGVALACGEPVCAPGEERALVDAFRAFCSAEKLTPAFAGTSARFATLAGETGWKTLKVGEEPLFDLDSYAPRGNRTKKVRSAANQATKTGVSVEVIPGGTRPSFAVAREMEELLRIWRSSRKVSALGFTLRSAPLNYAEDKVILLARKDGRLEAFLTCIPSPGRGAYTLEDMVRRPDAPNGASELLFLAATAECLARGAKLANLGLAPLRGAAHQPSGHRAIGAFLGFTFDHLNGFYKFRPLEHYKAKFGPTEWEDSFLVYRPGRLVRVEIALLSAFTPGRFGVARTALSALQETTSDGRRRVSPANAAGMAASATVAVGYSALAIHNPVLREPVEAVTRALIRPVDGAETMLRGHLIIDSIVLAMAGGWYARSAGRD